MASFGEIFSELRKDRGMRQKDFAEMMHISSSTVSNYETGAHYPDIEKLLEIADFFGVTTDYLLGRCSANLSPDVFDKPITPEMTVGEAIDCFSRLTPKKKQILQYLLLEFSGYAE